MKTHYRVAEISQQTGIARSTLFDAIKRGQIAALRLGKAIYIPAVEAKRLLGEAVSSDEEEGEKCQVAHSSL